ncbi:MAG TPA: OadG-related small transporter subunit [Planctomycetota bacterium]|nr:OadG-related small transporter subunit [Planctomycetota bacterium]
MLENLEFGVSLSIIGMLGTMVSLYALGLLSNLLARIFPAGKNEPKK